MKLTDFMKMSKKEFWNTVDKDGEAATATFKELWEKVGEATLTQDEATTCLNALFLYSHLRIREYNAKLAKNYPTEQFTKNRLINQGHLWWTDHFTAGISRWSTLNWFSAQKRKKKNGKMGLAGASTHFVQGYHDDPFYIIPLMHGAWHEPRRNKDSISTELVNAGGVHQNQKTNNWHYWAGPIPHALVLELPPVLLDKKYRGIAVMQPFTQEQIIQSIKLKRVIIAALPGLLDPCRMSQHSDWRAGKSDMGVLWPFDECNDAAFAADPILEMAFVQQYEDFLTEIGDGWDEVNGWDDHDDTDNPSYGEKTPTHDDDDDDDEKTILRTRDVQELLVQYGFTVDIDGLPGPKTSAAIKEFQATWNKRNPKDLIKVDGKAGPNTCEKLKRFK
jgi:N-acetyl-anhydromuramyl-L-alanine amidase AmpD